MDFESEIMPSLYQNTIQYLHVVSDKLPNSLDILKSFYSSKFRIVEAKGNVYLPWSRNKTYERCSRCCLQLCRGPAAFHVSPQEKNTKCAKKLLNKLRQSKKLTKFQIKYLKKVARLPHNYLNITCNFCQNKSKHTLAKPAKIQAENDEIAKPKKRNKKKKDKFCGLDVNAVVQAQNQTSEENNVIGGEEECLQVPANISNGKKKVKINKKRAEKLTAVLNAKPTKNMIVWHNFLESLK